MNGKFHLLNIGSKRTEKTMSEIKEYKKLNSFKDLVLKDKKEDNKSIIKIIENSILNNSYLENLSKKQLEVLSNVKNDLFDNNKKENKKFKLSKHVIEEILRLEEKKIPLYLVHRYRYEVYPEEHIIDEFPPYLQIEPSSICNYRCVFCFETDKTFTDKKAGFMGSMKIDLFKNIIDQAQGNIEFLSLASRGEPLICKDIIKMLKYTENKFLNLKMNTNASLLTEEKIHAILGGGIGTIVFSADAADEKLYSKLRVNGKLDRVLKNIELFNHIKEKDYKKNKIITRVSGVKVNNEQSIESMTKLWGNLVDQVAFVDYNPWENVYDSKASNIEKPCSDLWRRMFIWWDGKANPCDTDYKSTLSVGNFNNKSIKELWNSEFYKKLRENHVNNKRKNLFPCKNCHVT